MEALNKEVWEAEQFPDIEYPAQLPSCGQTCHRCMHSYDESGETFSPICDLTYDLQLWKGGKEGLFEGLTEQEVGDYAVENDPILWAHVELNWEARWYQAEILRCSSRRKVVRCGRRVGKTSMLGVFALWAAINRIDAPSIHKRYEVLIVTPADVQLQRIWRDITTFIDSNPRIKAKETRRVKDPVRTLELNNGSIIQLMVATPNVRGQDANVIIVDEADYCDDSFVASLYPIIMTHPDVYMWVSSTPTGFKTKFWEYCNRKVIGFKEFHFPSYVIPNYNAAMEFEFRNVFTDIEYDHEVKAEFGEAQMGVFKKELIANALAKFSYTYQDCAYMNPNGNYRVMGIDWNDQHGIHIIICEWDPNYQALKVVHKSIVNHKDLAYHKAIARITQLQLKWKCNHVYVDKGAGKMAMEALLIYGKQNPHSGLDKVVKGIAFGGRMDVRIPGTSEFEKKAVKPLVVNQSARRLEQLKVAFPIEERPGHGISDDGIRSSTLCSQMEEFKVERVTPNGIPVYSQGEDHTLVAWMCAVFGFVMEQTNILNYRNKSAINIQITHGLSSTASEAKARAGRYQEIIKDLAKERDSQLTHGRGLPTTISSMNSRVGQERDSRGNLPKHNRMRGSPLTKRSNLPYGSGGRSNL